MSTQQMLRQHRRWVKDQRMMRTSVAPVNVEAVNDLLDLVAALRSRLLVRWSAIRELDCVADGIECALGEDKTAAKWVRRIRKQTEVLGAAYK